MSNSAICICNPYNPFRPPYGLVQRNSQLICHSEFDLSSGLSPNLTDFETRVVWASMELRKYVQMLCSNTSQCNALKSDWCLKIENLQESKTVPNHKIYDRMPETGTSSSDKPKFWRPFISADPVVNPQPKYIVTDSVQEQKPVNLLDLTWKTGIPPITPTRVKLGERLKSVFRSVKRKKYQCHFCCMSYVNQGQLSGHIRIHTGSKPYRCDYSSCSRVFARNEELTRHRRIHSGYKPHQCNVCKKQFGRKDHLNKHCKTHLKTSEKKVYQCQYPKCEHKYTRSDALARHQATAHVTAKYNPLPNDVSFSQN